MSVSDAFDALNQAAAGLAHAHERGIVHRDIKLENILCARTGIPDHGVRLADFGYVNFVNGARDICLRSLVGTPVYVAPEVINRQEYGCAVDIYAVGVMLYRMLSGSYPFDGGANDELTMELAVGAELAFVEPEWESISPLCKGFIRALLQPRPERRLTAKAALHHAWLECEDTAISPEKLAQGTTTMSPVTPSPSNIPAYSLKKRISETINRLAARFSGESSASDDMEQVSVSDLTDDFKENSPRKAPAELTEEQLRQRRNWRKIIFATMFITKLGLAAGVRRAGPKRPFHAMVAEQPNLTSERELPDRKRGIANAFKRNSVRDSLRPQSTRSANRQLGQTFGARLRRTLSLTRA